MAETIAGRLEWRPSRWLLAVLLAMTPLAVFSLLASEMPALAAWPLAAAASAYGAWLARREWRRPRREFVFRGNSAPVLVDGEAVTDFELQWRGPLAFVCWRDGVGRFRCLAWWPDTLPAAHRRELRLAAPDGEAAPQTPSVAP